MNSRERVLCTMNHQEPDYVPVDFAGHRSSGISGMAYARLRKHLGLPQKTVRIFDIVQLLAIVDDDVLDLFGADTIELSRVFSQDDESWQDWVLPDGTPCQIPAWVQPEQQGDEWILRSRSGRVIARLPQTSPYFDQVYFPLEDGRIPGSDLPDVLAECLWAIPNTPPGPGARSEAETRQLVDQVRDFRQNTDRAILGLFGGSMLERGNQMFGHANYYTMLAASPEKVHAFLGVLTEYYLAQLEQFLESFGPFIDIIAFADDLGMQTGPQISPKMFREIFKPYHQRLWRRAKELADVKVMLHSCGSIRAFLPDLIDAGIEAVNPVQISARDMDAIALKHEFGDQIVFWGGGCDTQQILPHGTPEEIESHVTQQLNTFAPGGGYVFQQVHNIQADVPPENIVAMYDAVKAYRMHS